MLNYQRVHLGCTRMHVIQGRGATSGRSSRAPCLCTGRSRFNAWRVGRSPDESWVILPFQQDLSLWIPMLNFNDPVKVDTGLMLDVNIPMLTFQCWMCLSIQWKKSMTLPKNDLMSWKMTDLMGAWKKTHHIMEIHGCPAGTQPYVAWQHHLSGHGFNSASSTFKGQNTRIPGLSWINMAICGTPARCEVGISWAFGHLPRWASLPPPFVWRTIPAPSCGAGDRQSHRFGKPARNSWQRLEIAG